MTPPYPVLSTTYKENAKPAHSVSNWTVSRLSAMASCSELNKKELTPEQLSSVPCPTCGVAAGMRCLLHSGGLRTEPHLERKLSAIEAIKGK